MWNCKQLYSVINKNNPGPSDCTFQQKFLLNNDMCQKDHIKV